MMRVMENLAAAGLVAVLAAGSAQAAPFEVVTDGPDSVWVLNGRTGKLTSCRTVPGIGPKVIDVFGSDVQVRPTTPRRATPDCTVALAGNSATPRAVTAYGVSGYGPLSAYGGRTFGYGVLQHPVYVPIGVADRVLQRLMTIYE